MEFIPGNKQYNPMGHVYSTKFTERLFTRHRFMKTELPGFSKFKGQENKQIKLIKYFKVVNYNAMEYYLLKAN